MRTPQMIEYLREYVVVEIKCGESIGYFKTECGKNFLCGSNGDNECMDFSSDDVKHPKQIDETVTERCNVILVI